jgi:hypothetical protein
MNLPLNFSNPWGFAKCGVPLRVSIPFPAGAVRDPARDLQILEGEDEIAGQWRTLSAWPDGSARFVLLDLASDLEPRARRALSLQMRDGTAHPRIEPVRPVRVRETPDALEVDTGRVVWRFDRRGFGVTSIRHAGRELLAEPLAFWIEDACGQKFRACDGACETVVEAAGPHRAIVKVSGQFRNPLGTFFSYWLRFHFTAGGEQVLTLAHIRNRETGREGRDLCRATLSGRLTLESPTHRILHTVRTRNTIQMPIEVPENVDLDIGEVECALRNAASLREDPNDICWSLLHEKNLGSHRRCDPLLDIHQPGQGGLLLKFMEPDPVLEAPMRLAVDGAAFEIDLFPAAAEPHHFNEGMGKTRQVLFYAHDDGHAPADLFHDAAQMTYPGMTAIPAEWYRQSKFGDIHRTLPFQPNRHPMIETKIRLTHAPGDIQNKQSIKSHPLLGKCRGWRDFGDYVGLRGHLPEFGVRQYYNNEEDYIYTAMLDAWRRGAPVDAVDQARHLMDVDFIDHSGDPARDGAVCPHSTDHTNGEVYPSHQWCQGLLYYYLGTGDEEALRIARRIGDNLCGWVVGPRKESLRFSGRESAWPMISLAALYEVTGEVRYRDAGMAIIASMQEVVRTHGQMVWEAPAGSGILSPYMLAMAFNGVWDMYAATNDPGTLDLWKTLTAPVVAELEKPNSFGYVHFRNQHLIWADLTVLVRWYELTGDERYVRLGRNGLRLVMSGCPEPLIQSDHLFAMGYRHYILFMKLADEFGMLDDDRAMLVW